MPGYRYYWMRLCPCCDGQGRLVIMKDLSHDALYLHCEECEWGWRDPEKASDVAAGFLTLAEVFQARSASMDDITRHGWAGYLAGSFEEGG